MYSTKIGLEYQYDFTDAKFRTAFAFLHRADLADLPEGWIELENGVRQRAALLYRGCRGAIFRNA